MVRSGVTARSTWRFETELIRVPLESICPLYAVRKDTKDTVKYRQVAASIEEVGLVEPLVVVPRPIRSRKIRLLDGHVA